MRRTQLPAGADAVDHERQQQLRVELDDAAQQRVLAEAVQTAPVTEPTRRSRPVRASPASATAAATTSPTSRVSRVPTTVVTSENWR